MEPMILELFTREQSSYFPCDRFPLRIGRALDNDVIISNPTVSGHHAQIQKHGEDYYLVDLNSENGSKVGRQKVQGKHLLNLDGQDIRLGYAKLRFGAANQPVTATKLIGCQGWLGCLFESWLSALLLTAAVFGLYAYQVLLNTAKPVEAATLYSDLFTVAIGLLIVVGFLALFSRICVHRWDLKVALALVALIELILVTLLPAAGAVANYMFTSSAPGFWLNIAIVFVLTPIFTFLVFTRVQHIARPAALLASVVVMLASVAILFLQDDSDLFVSSEQRYKKMAYPNELLMFDIRTKDDISINEFLSKARALEIPED